MNRARGGCPYSRHSLNKMRWQDEKVYGTATSSPHVRDCHRNINESFSGAGANKAKIFTFHFLQGIKISGSNSAFISFIFVSWLNKQKIGNEVAVTYRLRGECLCKLSLKSGNFYRNSSEKWSCLRYRKSINKLRGSTKDSVNVTWHCRS